MIQVMLETQNRDSDSSDDSLANQFVDQRYSRYQRLVDHGRAQQQHHLGHWTDGTGEHQRPLQ